MGIIMHKGIAYGGGSDIEPNPSSSATDDLTKIGIDGTVYGVTDADAIHSADVGVANGVAELDANGKVPSGQLPSYVDDVVEGYYDSNTDRFYEESTFTTVIPPVDGKSWVDVATNKSYRWTGSVYVRVDEGVQLGETSSTAYRGDRGKTAYDHSQESGNPHGTDLSELDDVTISGATSGQVLKYNGSGWVNDDESGGLFTVVDGKVCITYETT